jgi:hypothetical protein
MMLIERALVKAGATHIAKSYEGESVTGFFFQLVENNKPIAFKLPVDVIAVSRVLKSALRRPRPGTLNRITEQAERTAWKLLYDWVDVQLSMIELQQAMAIQVFLPYAYDGDRNQTLFEKMQESKFQMLNAGAQEPDRLTARKEDESKR